MDYLARSVIKRYPRLITPILCSATGFIYKFTENYLSYPGTAITSSILTIAICILAAHGFYECADKQGVILGGKLANSLKALEH